MFNKQNYIKYFLVGGIGAALILTVLLVIQSRPVSKQSADTNTVPTAAVINPAQPYIPSAQNARMGTVIPPVGNETADFVGKQKPAPTLKPTDTPVSILSSALNTLYANNVQAASQQQEFLQLPEIKPSSLTPSPTANPVRTLINSMDTLFNLNGTNNNGNAPSNQQSSSSTQSLSGAGNPLSNFTYYPQCGGAYDTYPLAGGCNICQAGCGQTTTAMILSTYVDKRFTPPAVADLYTKNGVVAGCSGTNITNAQTIMEQNGLTTTDLIINTASDNTGILADFKSYLKSGWTLYALGRYCNQGCGHFFWIVDIDDNNNVWTYDPFYGRKKIPPPFNENQYSPFPYYRVAFGVKKP